VRFRLLFSGVGVLCGRLVVESLVKSGNWWYSSFVVCFEGFLVGWFFVFFWHWPCGPLLQNSRVCGSGVGSGGLVAGEREG